MSLLSSGWGSWNWNRWQSAVMCLLGDTPGSNFIGGFREGIGFSLRKCCRYMAASDDICEKVWIYFEENHLKYDLHTFIVDAEELIHCDLIYLISTKWTGWHSTTYGINNSSILFKLKGFDIITKCLPFDIMHSIF